jgi:NAD+ diphosphatase
MLCSSCGFVLFVNPSAAVATFIRNDVGDLLVCTRAIEPAMGTLDLPGGFVDANETSEEALIREIREELNAEVESVQYLFSLPNMYDYSGFSIPTLDLFFTCKLKTMELKASDDVASFSFVPFSAIEPELFGFSSIRKGVKKYMLTEAECWEKK